MAPNSGRNNKLNAIAFRLGTMSARHWVSRDEVARQLFEAAVACGLVNDDAAAAARATIKSGLNKGELSPHPNLEASAVKAAVAEPPPAITEPLPFADMSSLSHRRSRDKWQ
jgi:hypothetical protein